jgi:Tfp pilus assembly protein PilE
VTNTLKNEKGVTIVELLITISVGSIVIAMLMSILSSTMLTKNIADHENRLLDESYYISEYIQNRVFELGVRSIEDLSPAGEDHQIIRMNHEYDIIKSASTGVIYRDYSDSNSFILHYNSDTATLHYGPSDEFDMFNRTFINPSETQINSDNITVDNVTTLSVDCIEDAPFQNEEMKCASAIIQVNVTLNFRINDEPLFKPKRFESTIVF